MGTWLKANGGPPAIVVVGLGLIGLQPVVGATIAVIGAIWFALTLKPVQRRIPFTVVRKNTLVEQRLSERALGERCLALLEELQDLLAEHRRADPRALNWGSQYPSPGSAKGRAQEKAENEHGAKLQATYSRKYQGRAVWLLHEIETRHLADSSAVWRASHAGSSVHSMNELANLLSIVGHRLTERDEDAQA
jgi:hypothetical protein